MRSQTVVKRAKERGEKEEKGTTTLMEDPD